jgi:hypothetical protein
MSGGESMIEKIGAYPDIQEHLVGLLDAGPAKAALVIFECLYSDFALIREFRERSLATKFRDASPYSLGMRW